MMKIDSEQELEKLIDDLLRVNEATLEKELIEHSARYAWFAVLLAKARRRYEQEKFELDVLEAELGKEYREKLKKEVKVTERAIEEAILRDERWQEKKKSLLSAKEEMEVMEAIVDALACKKDMLVSYVSLLKEQLKSGILDDVGKGVKRINEEKIVS